MTNWMPALARPVAAALVVATAGWQTALAQPAPAAIAIWDWFAETCPSVVAAADPVNYAASLEGVSGGLGQSVDGRIRMASLEVSGLPAGGGPALLMTFVNDYDDGRAVQCTLQLISPEEALDGLSNIAQEQAARILGDGGTLTVAGGPAVGVNTSGFGPDDMEDAEMVRISTAGFPPQGVLSLNVSPQFVLLSLHVLEAHGGG